MTSVESLPRCSRGAPVDTSVAAPRTLGRGSTRRAAALARCHPPPFGQPRDTRPCLPGKMDGVAPPLLEDPIRAGAARVNSEGPSAAAGMADARPAAPARAP